MKLKSTKLFLCGLLGGMFLIRNLEDGQFIMSFFFTVVAWQCIRAAFEAKGFESDKQRQEAFRKASEQVYGPLGGVAWALPYGVLAVCAAVGGIKPELQWLMPWIFLGAVVLHALCEIVIWRKAKKL